MSSNFTSLLSDLTRTAKSLAEPSSSSSHNRKKRHREEDDPSTVKTNEITDRRQLTIHVSFLCIGAQKAGTTWLYEMLASIDGVGLASQKEVHFWDWNRRKGLGWYSRQFPSKGILGEVTPCYMTLSEKHVAEIRALFPSLKIIFLARDLVERAWSAMTMELRNNARGLKPGQFDIPHDQMNLEDKKNLVKDSNPRSYPDAYFMNVLRNKTHTDRSDYTRGLRIWLNHFPKEQLLILNYRQVSENPKHILKQVLAHIGLDGGNKLVDKLTHALLGKRVNSAIDSNTTIRPALQRQMLEHLSPFAKSFNDLLKELGYDWTIDNCDPVRRN